MVPPTATGSAKGDKFLRSIVPAKTDRYTQSFFVVGGGVTVAECHPTQAKRPMGPMLEHLRLLKPMGWGWGEGIMQ